jgi:hypothetical protein
MVLFTHFFAFFWPKTGHALKGHPVVSHEPRAHPGSSVEPSQSSSMPLQTSYPLQVPVQVELQIRVPEVPQLVVHEVVVFCTQAKSSSFRPSQSSSRPLHFSAGGTQVPQVQVFPQLCVPLEPQLVLQLWEVPLTQA